MTRIPMKIETLVGKIADVFRGHKDIRLAYLFGSYVQGTLTNRSDIDIGVNLTEEGLQNPWRSSELQEELFKKISIGHSFDVRVLNGASPKFLYEVIHQTPKILVRDENSRVEFETRVLIEWFDLRISIETFRRERAGMLHL